ncbi:hypothetical protein DVS77_33810 [Mycolicibacterium moriokaense]|nr:hypothetical protein DVS77_33810 [Mycolicibacterium moriokaense]
MRHSLKRLTGTALAAATLAGGAMAGVTVVSPAVGSACLPGETGVTNGCAPFCLPGKALDVPTGLCVAVPDPAPDGVNAPINDY